MSVSLWLKRVLTDEALTRGLGDPEARMLMEWLTEQIERLPPLAEGPLAAAVRHLCLQARRFRSFVVYWCHEFNHEGAVQLAAVEGFSDRLPPTTLLQPCDVMEHLLRPAESNVCVWRAAA